MWIILPYSTYTERQKKLITSSERRSLKSSTSKLIIFGHWLAIVLLMKHIWKIKGLLLSKRRKMQCNHKNMTETAHWEPPRKAAYSEHSIESIRSISVVGYVTPVLAFVRAELRARKGSSFCDFWKITSCDFTSFYSILPPAKVFLNEKVMFLLMLGV